MRWSIPLLAATAVPLLVLAAIVDREVAATPAAAPPRSCERETIVLLRAAAHGARGGEAADVGAPILAVSSAGWCRTAGGTRREQATWSPATAPRTVVAPDMLALPEGVFTLVLTSPERIEVEALAVDEPTKSRVRASGHRVRVARRAVDGPITAHVLE